MSTAAQYLALSRRSIVTMARQPVAVFPPMVFPLFFLALTSSALDTSTELPGFPPVDSFLQFAVSTTIIQGALFSSVAAGSAMAGDIEGGFFERLVATPASRMSILVGRIAGAALVGFLQAWLFFAVTHLFGLRVEGGFLGMLAVASIGAVFSAGVGALAMSFGLRTGSAEATQGAFPLLFAFLFISSAFFPRDLMEGWFKTAASINPLSHLIEGARAQVIFGLDLVEFLTSLGIAVTILVLGLLASSAALRARLAQSS